MASTRTKKTKKHYDEAEAAKLAAAVRACRRKLADLLSSSAEIGTRHAAHHDALEELKAAIEELALAHKLLAAQSDELAILRAALEHERAKYVELFQAATDGYAVTDLCGVISEVNAAFAVMVGWPIPRILGKPLENFVHEKWHQHLRQRLDNLESSAKADWNVKIDARLEPNFIASVRMTLLWNEKHHLIGIRWSFKPVKLRGLGGTSRSMNNVGGGLFSDIP